MSPYITEIIHLLTSYMNHNFQVFNHLPKKKKNQTPGQSIVLDARNTAICKLCMVDDIMEFTLWWGKQTLIADSTINYW